MSRKTAFKAAKIFTGTDVLTNHAVIVSEGLIDDVLPVVSVDADIETKDLGDNIITAPFIDLQLYGANKKLLAVEPTVETYREIFSHCRAFGTGYSMPTLATNTNEVFFAAIDALREYWKQGGEGILGLHIEGPWIHPSKKGAHVEALIHSPSIEEVKELLAYGNGVIKIITLAPEQCSKEIIDLIRSQNILVFAGHSNANYEQATETFDWGVDGVTHLYNAMSPLQHRAPGLVGATFNHHTVRASIIPDGYHVDFAAVRIAKNIMKERLFVITDAVTETNEGHYQHKLVGEKYEANGVLSGSALTMNKAVKNLVEHVGISAEEALKMCNVYPAKLLNRTDITGFIKKGYPAEFIVMDDQFNVVDFIDLN